MEAPAGHTENGRNGFVEDSPGTTTNPHPGGGDRGREGDPDHSTIGIVVALRRELRGAYRGGLPGSGRADNLRAKGDRKAVPDRAQFHETVCGGYKRWRLRWKTSTEFRSGRQTVSS